MPPPITIRPATADDIPLILALIRELAEYEKEPDAAVATAGDLGAALFSDSPTAECVIGELDGAPQGFALYFTNFSTWLGRPGMYLEDLFVRPAARGRGLGKALLVHLAKVAVERNYGRFEWSVLDWNTPAIDFYRALGATPMSEWTVHRVSGEALRTLASMG